MKSKNYVSKLLRACKEWGGPCTSIKEMQYILKSKPERETEIIKAEMAFYANTHKADKIARPDLFRQNGISHEEKMENLSILLDNEDTQFTTVADLPTNEEVLSILSSSTEDKAPESEVLKINDLCVVVWQNDQRKYEWYIGYVKSSKPDSLYHIDHLHRVDAAADVHWKYPSREDNQTAERNQVVSCDVEGQWDISPDMRKRIFTISNIRAIRSAVKDHTL